VCVAVCLACGWGSAWSADSALDRQISRLEREVDRLEAARAVKHLQRAYGFYLDRALWNEIEPLFVEDGTIELGSDGVYVGRSRIRQYLQRLGEGQVGLKWGRIAEHLQLQPVIHVSADGLSAKGRWRDFALLGEFHKNASWGEGIYENEYVKRNGVWMIKSIHLYTTFVAPYEKGWARVASSTDWRTELARAFPPDRPPSRRYATFPEPFVAPFHYENPSRARDADEAGADASSDPRLAPYQRQLELLRDHDAVENLQASYGYYFDKNLWDEVAALFSSNATFEDGQRGVYVGQAHIRRALELFGPKGPQRGWLNNYFQLQPVIHVASDGRTAKARWQGVLQLSRPNTSGAWGLGVYENEYVKESGRWKISKLHFYATAMSDYDLLWTKGPIPVAGPSTVLPPDRPPTEVYRSLPGVYIPPFHYPHPVTGQPIVTDPQPADSVVRPQGERP
jgi:SnoaL-like domain